ncbi:hypothetical protein [Marinobacter sp.]|uniref:hypothetical protein n=1 Tax=Marinobacter sp. TaxID=50741 RepID=UPI003A9470A3
MGAKPLNKAERAWLTKLQKVLDECPSNRLAAYTIGDPDITLYDSSFDQQIDDSGCDVPEAIARLDASLEYLRFPFPVHCVRG